MLRQRAGTAGIGIESRMLEDRAVCGRPGGGDPS
jgi:hypothetical protein